MYIPKFNPNTDHVRNELRARSANQFDGVEHVDFLFLAHLLDDVHEAAEETAPLGAVPEREINIRNRN